MRLWVSSSFRIAALGRNSARSLTRVRRPTRAPHRLPFGHWSASAGLQVTRAQHGPCQPNCTRRARHCTPSSSLSRTPRYGIDTTGKAPCNHPCGCHRIQAEDSTSLVTRSPIPVRLRNSLRAHTRLCSRSTIAITAEGLLGGLLWMASHLGIMAGQAWGTLSFSGRPVGCHKRLQLFFAEIVISSGDSSLASSLPLAFCLSVRSSLGLQQAVNILNFCLKACILGGHAVNYIGIFCFDVARA